MPLTTNLDDAELFLCVDVANTVKRAAEAPGPTKSFCNRHKYPTGYMHVSIGKIYAALKHYGLNKNLRTCLMLSAQENSEHRRKLYPGYKAGRVRKEYSPLEVTTYTGVLCEKTPAPVDDFMEAMSFFPAINAIMEIPHETDDCIASFVTQMKKRNKKAIFVILTNDRDAWALMGPRVICTSKPGEEFTLDNLEKDYLTRNPKLLPLAKALFGDKSDKIKKAVARVTEDNFPRWFFDCVKPTKGKSLVEVFAEALQKNKKRIKGTSLELCIGKEKEISDVLKIIRLRTKLKLQCPANKPDLKKMQALLGWYELRSISAQTEVMFKQHFSNGSKK